MAYFLDLFSPETYEAFSRSDREVSGFRISQRSAAEKIEIGDKFLCYITGISRWVGVLEVISRPFENDLPLFIKKDDPFILRFKVRPLIWLDKNLAIPIKEENIWNTLTFTRGQDKTSSRWTGKLRSSLTRLVDDDGQYLEDVLSRQVNEGMTYQLLEEEYARLLARKPSRNKRKVKVVIPDETNVDETAHAVQDSEIRESYQIQALLAKIGEQMGMQIWLPRNDRGSVLKEWKPRPSISLDNLPLNYDEKTIRTIEQIDVLWLRGRSIVRAFEVEHSTAVYSGLLRMADLLALQPNMDIKLHIVAPSDRRNKVFQELHRPVFSLLQRGPLSDLCTFMSYDKVKELSMQKLLRFMSDAVLDEYSEQV